MNDVDRWFARTARTRRAPVSLYACLLTGRLATYFRYRLRFPFLVATVRFAVHVAEFFVVLSSLGGVAAFIVMVMRAGSLLVSGAWWGLLEIMRDRLRVFARLGRPQASEFEIGRWLTLAAVVGVAVAAVGGGALLAMRPAGADAVTHLYAFLIVVEVSIGFVVRVLHSGIYATRRIYKPVWSMFVPTAVQLVILAAGFFYYPAAAILLAIVVSNALSIGITVHYTREAYRLTGLRPRWTSGGGLRANLPALPPRLAVATTLSGLSFRLDAVLVLALIGFYGTDTRTFDLTAGVSSWQQIDSFQFFYLILPLFRATYESAGIFYFDFVRLRAEPVLRDLQVVFFRRLMWAAPVVALFFWALAVVLGTVVLHDVPIGFLAALVPLFVLRSYIGVYQIRLFAEGRFGTHLATLALLVALLWMVWLNPDPAGDLVQISAAMVVQFLVLMNLQHLQDRRDPPLPPLLSLREWLTTLAAEPGAVVVGRLRILASSTPAQRAAAVRTVGRLLAGRGHFGFLTTSTVLLYRRCTTEPAAGPAFADVQIATGFVAGRGAVLGDPLPGPAALTRLVDSGWVEPPEPGIGEADLSARFRALFGECRHRSGVVFDAETLGGAARMRTLDPALLATVLPAAAAGREDGADVVVVQSRLCTAEFHRGAVRRLFVLPADPAPEGLRGWRRAVRAWNTAPAREAVDA